jgi:ABC-type uncharacterized transport system fused permease/ATPase subunit
MKIKTISETDSDYRTSFKIRINNQEVASFYDGEPEDNSLGRNFNDVYKIVELMKLAYDAGKNGEDFSEEHIER